jgi:filamentous hemagglutinin family protein
MDSPIQRSAAIMFLAGQIVVGAPALAQIMPDGTLPTVVNSPDNLNFTIEGGGRSGSNLFHSFSQFSVPTNGSALFNNAADVLNIFSRVTGSQVSSIDGLLQTQATSNLFLLNPNGIVFGPNAKLNIGGSFLGTTASSFKFMDNTEFSASNPQSLLTISVPIGLQMGQTPGRIVVQPKTNLVGAAGKTMALVGGDIAIDDATISVSGGHIELASLGDNAIVQLTPQPTGFSLSYNPNNLFQDIALINNALIDGSGPTGSSFQLQGRNILLGQGSSIYSYTKGAGRGGNATIYAQNLLRLQSDVVAEKPSRIAVAAVGEVEEQPDPSRPLNAQVGDITVRARQIELFDGAQIRGGSFNNATAASGTIDVAADRILLTGAMLSQYVPSAIQNESYLTNTAPGDVIVRAQDIRILNGASIGNLVYVSKGDGGRIIIDAKNLEIAGNAPQNRYVTSLNSVLGGAEGRSGDIIVNVENLKLDEGGTITNGAYFGAKGKTGDILINAKTITISGSSPSIIEGNRYISSISSAAGSSQVDTGNIKINADSINIKDGGLISSALLAESTGKAGDILIQAGQIQMAGQTYYGQPSMIDSSIDESQGKGGNIDITAQGLQLFQGAEIASGLSKKANGEAGKVNLQVRDILVSGAGEIDNVFQRSSIQSAVDADSQGVGGLVRLIGDRITVENGGQITSSTLGLGPAGNIEITSNTTRVEGKFIPATQAPVSSEISAIATSAFTAGSVKINSKTLAIKDTGKVTVSNTGSGDSGNLIITANRVALDQNAILEADVGSGTQGNLQINAQVVTLNRGSRLSTSSNSISNGGNIDLRSTFLVGLNNSDIIANAIQGRGGQIQITTQGIFGLKNRDRLTPGNDITASSEFGVSGTVQVTTFGIDPNSGLTILPVDIVDPSQKIATGCATRSDSSFVATGRGGIPKNPMQVLEGDRIWSDLRSIANAKPAAKISTASIPIEATALWTNSQGQIELIGEGVISSTQIFATCAR